MKDEGISINQNRPRFVSVQQLAVNLDAAFVEVFVLIEDTNFAAAQE